MRQDLSRKVSEQDYCTNVEMNLYNTVYLEVDSVTIVQEEESKKDACIDFICELEDFRQTVNYKRDSRSDDIHIKSNDGGISCKQAKIKLY